MAEINKVPNYSKKDESTNNDVVLQEEFVSGHKKCSMITQKGASSRKNEPCSLHGLQFSVCAISAREIEKFSMLGISNECYDIKDSENIEISN